jgi:hypothetical protein
VDNLNAPRHLDAETVLKEIEIQQGILVERARNAYSFSHLTFQEYLTAKCIVDNNKIDHLVRDHSTEKHWREVFLLVAGLAPGKHGVDNLLLEMDKKSRSCFLNNEVKAFIAWADRTTDQSTRIPPRSAKRIAAILIAHDLAFALFFALSPNHRIDDSLSSILVRIAANEIPLSNARIFLMALSNEIVIDYSKAVNLALILASEYQRLKIFPDDLIEIIVDLGCLKEAVNDSFLRENHREFAEKLIQCFFVHLRLKLSDVAVSTLGIEQLTSYFSILELMIRCKEAAVRVSPQVWAGIEERMVTVPKE